MCKETTSGPHKRLAGTLQTTHHNVIWEMHLIKPQDKQQWGTSWQDDSVVNAKSIEDNLYDCRGPEIGETLHEIMFTYDPKTAYSVPKMKGFCKTVRLPFGWYFSISCVRQKQEKPNTSYWSY